MQENSIGTFHRTLQKKGPGSVSCNIPSEARDFLDFTPGTEVDVHVDLQQGRVIIEPSGGD